MQKPAVALWAVLSYAWQCRPVHTGIAQTRECALHRNAGIATKSASGRNFSAPAPLLGSPSSLQPLLIEMLCGQDYSSLFKKLRLACTYNEKCSLPPSPVPTHREALLAI